MPAHCNVQMQEIKVMCHNNYAYVILECFLAGKLDGLGISDIRILITFYAFIRGYMHFAYFVLWIRIL